MADRMAAEIRIGGKIPPGLVEDLCGAIAGSDVTLDWGEADFRPQTAKDLQDSCRGSRLLTLRDDERAWGEFPDLEEFLREHRIAYDRWSDGKYEHDSVLESYRPEQGLFSFYTSKDGCVLTPVDKLWKVQRSFHRLMGQAKTLSKKELLIRFRRWEKQFAAAVPVQLPPLPPLTIVPEPPRAGKKL